MSVKRKLINIIAVALCMALVSASMLAGAEVFNFETQYEHESADIAWLTELTFKHNLTTVGRIVTPLPLVARSDYPYRETASGFAADVDSYVSLYTLTEGSPRSAYLYFFELLSSASGLAAGELSDEEIKSYLVNQGIAYPAGGDSDTRVVARAIYVAMATGALGAAAPGSSLDEVAINFIANLTGSSPAALAEWMPEGQDVTLDEYILAASKFTLWSAGYDVDADTDEQTVYRLVAAMTIEKNGITADANSDFETLRLKFLAAMLGKRFEVSIDWTGLGDALASGSVPLYVLKAIGRKHGVAVGSRGLEDAFLFVAENTGIFDLEAGEFYADIYDYDLWVPAGTDRVWVNPAPYNNSGSVVVSANEHVMKNNYYNEVALDAEAETQLVTISVVSVSGKKTSTCEYRVTVHSGGEAPVEGQTNSDLVNAVDGLFLSSETLLAGVLAGIRTTSYSSSVVARSFGALDNASKNVMAAIAPTFGDTADIPTDAAALQEKGLSFLDKIGSYIDSDISGIGGLDFIKEHTGDLLSGGAVTFDR